MVIRDKFITLGADVVHAFGLTALRERVGAIFMLHSVMGQSVRQMQLSEHSSAEFLESVLRHYRRRGFVFVTLDEALRRIEERRAAEKFISLTFDDGYRDNLTTVLPLLERYASPFTVYVTTDIVERQALYWWGGLRDIVQNNDMVDYEPIGRRLPTRTLAQKVKTYYAISGHVRSGASQPADIERLMTRHGVGNSDLLDRDMLSREDLRTLSRHPLVTIGGHTQTHRSLRQLSLEQANEEIEANRAYLRDCIEKPVRHFAYPFGDRQSCGEREFSLVATLGFDTGVTTRRGNLAGNIDPFAMPRVLFSGMRESIGYIELQRTGLMGTGA